MKFEIKTFPTGLLTCVMIFSSNNAYANKQKLSESNQLKKAYYQLLQKTRLQKTNSNSHRANIPHYRAVQVAKKQLRIKYLWGGKSPQTGFDCCGLIQYSYQKANISIPRTSTEQYKNTKRIKVANLRVGDLIFFKTRKTRKPVNHVGIYMGSGNFIHAPRPGKHVTIAKLNKYWKHKLVGAGRI